MLLVEFDASDRWWISTPEASWNAPESGNKIMPPITYGQVPSGINDSYGPEPLLSGQAYELVLWRVLPTGSAAQCQQRFENFCLIALQPFTR